MPTQAIKVDHGRFFPAYPCRYSLAFYMERFVPQYLGRQDLLSPCAAYHTEAAKDSLELSVARISLYWGARVV